MKTSSSLCGRRVRRKRGTNGMTRRRQASAGNKIAGSTRFRSRTATRNGSSPRRKPSVQNQRLALISIPGLKVKKTIIASADERASREGLAKTQATVRRAVMAGGNPGFSGSLDHFFLVSSERDCRMASSLPQKCQRSAEELPRL
ncbi:hypothetical protein AGR9A_Lc40545 [Agrobacterium salinitolerans str. Hayward 0363]|nr:hypothetical protein AGR9A_Lc40545 [Agrobacterium salinitolerans str. Hayward 0363]